METIKSIVRNDSDKSSDGDRDNHYKSGSDKDKNKLSELSDDSDDNSDNNNNNDDSDELVTKLLDFWIILLNHNIEDSEYSSVIVSGIYVLEIHK